MDSNILQQINEMAADFGCSPEHLQDIFQDLAGSTGDSDHMDYYIERGYMLLSKLKSIPHVENRQITGYVPAPIALDNLKALQELSDRNLADDLIRDILQGSDELSYPGYIKKAKLSHQYPQFTPSQIHLLFRGLTPEKVELIDELNLNYNYESSNSRSYICDEMLQFMKEHSVDEITKAFNFSAQGLTQTQQDYLVAKYYTTGNRALIDLLIARKDEWANIQEDEEERGLDYWVPVYKNAPNNIIAEANM